MGSAGRAGLFAPLSLEDLGGVATRLVGLLALSAFCSLHHPPARDCYARKRTQGKKHNPAILCLARRRCDLIHKMLTTGQTYGELPARPAQPLPDPWQPDPP